MLPFTAKRLTSRKMSLRQGNRVRKFVGLQIIALLFTWAAGGRGQEPESKPPWYKTISVNGFLSVAYSYNFNKPDSLKNQYHVFDFDDNSMKIDVVQLCVRKEVANPNDAGFRVDLTAGSSIPRVTRSAGLNVGDLDFPQLFLSYIVPLGSGVRFDVGKFSTSMGYEVIEGFGAYNDNYSRSFLFGYAIPFTHTGVKASYGLSKNVSAMIMVVNGWDNAIDNNTSKSFCGQIGILPTHNVSIFLNHMVGPEKSGNNTDNRRLFDLASTWSFTEKLIVGANADFGTEERSTTEGRTASWVGVAGYVRLNPFSAFSVSLRAEQFEDRDGLRTGVVQKLREVTLTPEYRATEHLVIRADLRLDDSSEDVFETERDLKNTQMTASLNVLYTF